METNSARRALIRVLTLTTSRAARSFDLFPTIALAAVCFLGGCDASQDAKKYRKIEAAIKASRERPGIDVSRSFVESMLGPPGSTYGYSPETGRITEFEVEELSFYAPDGSKRLAALTVTPKTGLLGYFPIAERGGRPCFYPEKVPFAQEIRAYSDSRGKYTGFIVFYYNSDAIAIGMLKYGSK
jgi:hypothetical protein